jgi:hypothetical protein
MTSIVSLNGLSTIVMRCAIILPCIMAVQECIQVPIRIYFLTYSDEELDGITHLYQETVLMLEAQRLLLANQIN